MLELARETHAHADDTVADSRAGLGRYFDIEDYAGEQLVNVGWGEDITIGELAELVGDIVGYRGKLEFDPSKPDGSPRKLLDVSKLKDLGWQAQTPLRAGIESTYRWFLDNLDRYRE